MYEGNLQILWEYTEIWGPFIILWENKMGTQIECVKWNDIRNPLLLSDFHKLTAVERELEEYDETMTHSRLASTHAPIIWSRGKLKLFRGNAHGVLTHVFSCKIPLSGVVLYLCNVSRITLIRSSYGWVHLLYSSLLWRGKASHCSALYMELKSAAPLSFKANKIHRQMSLVDN